MKINRIIGREFFNACGQPALFCELILDDGTFVSASVASDIAFPQSSKFILKDGGTRCAGQGLQKAIYNLESIVAPALVGKNPEVYVLDALLAELDNSFEKSSLGANVMLAASMAVCKAQAVVEEIELFEMIAQLHGSGSVSLPFPLVTAVSGGPVFKNGFPFQGITLVPVGAQSFRMAFEYALTVLQMYTYLLTAKGKSHYITNAGGVSSSYDLLHEPFDLLLEALKMTNLESFFVLAIDVAADSFYDHHTQKYFLNGEPHTTTQLIAIYKKLCDMYPLYSLENATALQDIKGAEALFEALGTTIQIASNDEMVQSTVLLQQATQGQQTVNALVITLPTVSTVTELLERTSACQNYGLNTIISVSSGETDESFLADFSVGTSAGQVQAGGGFRGEYLSKYNRLLWIEDFLALQLLNNY